MTSDHIARQEPARNLLAFNGVEIHDKGEMLCLTDMWKAAGGDPAKAPAQWLRTPGAEAFVEAVLLNVGKSHNDVVRSVRGGKTPGTWAHWQIGLSYAKYLDPHFHMLCNTWVRERMEGRPAPVPAVHDLTDEVRSVIGGIVKRVVHSEVAQAVAAIVGARVAPTFDLSGSMNADDIIERAGIKPGERVRGTANMVTRNMLEFTSGVGCFKTPKEWNRSRPWRFPRDKAEEWLFGPGYGAEAIRNQIASQRRRKDKKGQGALRLVPPPDAPPL